MCVCVHVVPAHTHMGSLVLRLLPPFQPFAPEKHNIENQGGDWRQHLQVLCVQMYTTLVQQLYACGSDIALWATSRLNIASMGAIELVWYHATCSYCLVSYGYSCTCSTNGL